jgi:3-dehydroquinate synthase
MPTFQVETPPAPYRVVVERGILQHAARYLPTNGGKVFVVSTDDVWRHQCARLEHALAAIAHDVLFLPAGEDHKRLAPIEQLAEEMVRLGADRSSVVVAFGGGIVTDMAGFLAAIFMRGIPVVQIPTTLLAQVDASIGGKTGVNLGVGKNLIGSFHQPLAVLIDADVLATLPDREYRAGLYEILKAGVIRSEPLFRFLAEQSAPVLAREREAVDRIIAESVEIKVQVVSADEREGGLRRILNFGHTFGHALETETGYTRFLHGEAVAFGMRAAVYLAQMTGHLSAEDTVDILEAIQLYGPIPSLQGVAPERLLARLASDKKTVQGQVHFVLPERIGEVQVVFGIGDEMVLAAVRAALA